MRYVLLRKIDNDKTVDLNRICAALSLELVYSGRHVAVFAHSNSQIVELPGGRGIVLGKLYERENSQPLVSMTDAQAERILDSHGRVLMSDFWGGYVAILTTQELDLVIRDPSGSVPCYYLSRHDSISLSSDPTLLVELGLLDPDLDHSYLVQHLRAISLRPSQTGFRGLVELLRGERLLIRPASVVRDTLWSPWEFAIQASNYHEQDGEAEELRALVETCARSLTAGMDHLLVDLSGGLDSSILTAALAPANRVTCLNFLTSQASGDEIHFASAVAGAFGLPMETVQLDVEEVDLSTSAASSLPRPTTRSFVQAWDCRAREVAQRIGADGYVNGAGGDNVFCSLQSVAPVADRLLVWRHIGGVLRSAGDLSELTGCSALTALTRGMRRAWRMPPTYRWLADREFLLERVDEPHIDPSLHPWFNVPEGGLPGSAAHIALLLQIENHLESFSRKPMIYPLLAQPIVEWCLSKPSWRWCQGGQNRVLAREAFSNILPDGVVRRRDKGTPESFLVDLFEAKKTQIREIVGDGMLASWGIIDREAILRAIDHAGPARGLTHSRILRIVDVEAWIHSWTERRMSRQGKTPLLYSA
ncbi:MULTISPECIES: asparagine synthase-related protein [unclassified Sphingobium]|uniref:asparagine synthase-related protein n=1 Tax=unclassified Sphingobium TaxID=2611147 RepID=UPI00044EBF5A|nr:asparagine synthetase B family protein [Sphingobium sp. Ant17]EXS69379.1 hypothetical protein BF95_21080 [Sphingobium sp. Ant17]